MTNNRLEQLKTFLQEEPNDPFLQYSMALEYLKLDEDQEALKVFENLMKEQPDYLPTYYHLGKLYEKLLNTEEAIRTYEIGILLARKQNNSRTLRELNEALNNLRFEG
ncbi:MAG: tetratricopeptide repeat protein [Bacteroidota bacterium]